MSVTIDRKSLLAEVDAGLTLREVETQLASSELTLDVEGAQTSNETIASWLARGAKGARDAWLDPADHLVAGLEMRLHDGTLVAIRPAPRRAVGPDLVTLVVGMEERYARVERVWLRVHRVGVKRPNVGKLAVDLDPPLESGEKRLLEAIARSLETSDHEHLAPLPASPLVRGEE
jgi:alkyldihydroxyacetonephosphate synthase